ncbi:related to mitochondrial tryptophanyl-tRNA synthetase [Ramularia collo-cygni]|uniref:Tryptophan--tRNA ligase, mitochondrial n=1 Tax=Ramularia collo-cygni TaxID=112498 RepID=A0A2D3VCI8_9PEZI|nr:related to mitochondrial tryptophanyl-tRNA synthetase [Ramularia collo-cygni]CZT21436.1 related to mitochondrial tryptophanyl-tRNA synthetase [Ramularia collo-cygni]
MRPRVSLYRRGGSLPNAFVASRRVLSSGCEARNKTIFSGIQPTGVPHLGNYLGALREWVKLQNQAEPSTRLIYSLVDLHAITIRQQPNQLRQWRKESLAMLLAIGLDPRRSTLFHQSDVPAHSELMWILSCQASTGYLGRMTQWKEKTSGEKDNSERLKLGLFSYPVLQAADVLLHQTTHVPVGHDQAQHLEFAREVANGFNHVYGDGLLTVPETLISPAKRIMSLSHPTSKMSKSHPNPKSRILLTDSEEVIRSKVKTAVTDSVDGITYDTQRRPGVSNLLDLIYHTAHPDGLDGGQEALAGDMADMSLRAVKDRAAAAIEAVVRPIRERYAQVIQNDQLLSDVALRGANDARTSASKTMEDVKRAVGLL